MQSKDSLHKENKAQFSYVIYFIVVMVIFLPILLIGFPVLQTIAVGFAGASEPFILQNQEVISGMADSQLKTDLNDAFNAQMATQASRIDILNSAIIFGGPFLIIIVFIGIYLLSRRNIEVGSMG